MNFHQQKTFEASCGTEILREASRIRIPWRKRVWMACGEIMIKFDTEIMPEIEALLQNEDPGYADYYFSVVMVGIRQATAKPKILVSCTNSDVRTEVLKIVKGSHHIRDGYPEFGFGESSVPLHEPVPSVPLAGQTTSNLRISPTDIPAFIDAPQARSSRSGEVLASDHHPSAGRMLFLPTASSEPARYATGGIVIRIGDRYYQKTVGHVDEPECSTIPQWSADDVDYCRFDDDSDNDDDDDDALQFDCDITSRGSITPEDNLSQAISESYIGNSETASLGMTPGPSSLPESFQFPLNRNDSITDALHKPSQSNGGMEVPHGLNRVGQLSHSSRNGKKPGLDYSLVLLDAPFDLRTVNRICMDSSTGDYLQIRGIEAVPTTERDIITVTASGGITHGKLLPSAVYLRISGQSSLQKMYVVQLSTVVVDGDCGADVVDEKTGDIYGHIVRGCRGTQIAYIVSAKHVFEDLRDRVGTNMEIVLSGQTEKRANHGADRQGIGCSSYISARGQNDTQSTSENDTDRHNLSSKKLWNETIQLFEGVKLAVQWLKKPRLRDLQTAGDEEFFLPGTDTSSAPRNTHGATPQPLVPDSAASPPQEKENYSRYRSQLKEAISDDFDQTSVRFSWNILRRRTG